MDTKLKIAICSLSIGEEYREITKYSAIIKEQYCKKHNYTFIEDLSVYNPDKTIHWSKLLLLLKYLKDFDYIVWIDADIYIMNQEITLENFIQNIMGDKDIMTGSDWKMSNTGTIFVKNTKWSEEFLTAVYNHTNFPQKGNFEQDAFQDLHDSNYIQAKEHIVTAYPTDINSYWFNYYNGHFILHFAGSRGEGLKMHTNMFCPIRKDDDTDETYEKRMTWLKGPFRYDMDKSLKSFKEHENP
jgi:hypothetical protein